MFFFVFRRTLGTPFSIHVQIDCNTTWIGKKCDLFFWYARMGKKKNFVARTHSAIPCVPIKSPSSVHACTAHRTLTGQKVQHLCMLYSVSLLSNIYYCYGPTRPSLSYLWRAIVNFLSPSIVYFFYNINAIKNKQLPKVRGEIQSLHCKGCTN